MGTSGSTPDRRYYRMYKFDSIFNNIKGGFKGIHCNVGVAGPVGIQGSVGIQGPNGVRRSDIIPINSIRKIKINKLFKDGKG